jgi:hypothetical protein
MRDISHTMRGWGFQLKPIPTNTKCLAWTTLIGCPHRTFITLEVHIGKDGGWAIGKLLVTCKKCQNLHGCNYADLGIYGEGRGELLLQLFELGIKKADTSSHSL